MESGAVQCLLKGLLSPKSSDIAVGHVGAQEVRGPALKLAGGQDGREYLRISQRHLGEGCPVSQS